MSATSDGVKSSVQLVLNTAWDVRDGQVVPSTDDVKLAGGAVSLDATYLYADLANSSGAAQRLRREVTGKILRTYLDAATRIIKRYDGVIRSFDGDRVMGIFVGNRKNTNAMNAGLGINWAVQEVLKPKLADKWPTLKDTWTLAHGVGIATGDAFIVRGGVRGSNDLVSVGEAPNVAAKLSALRGWPSTYVTKTVFDECLDDARFSRGDNELMWSNFDTQWIGGKSYSVKGSTWWRTP